MPEHVITVQMAGINVIQNSGGDMINLKTILGSCVGIILSDKKKGIHGLAHIMLPETIKQDQTSGKYADTAIPLLLKKMESMGSSRNNMQAFVLGGACMFFSENGSGLMKIGDRNIKATRRILNEFKIPIVFEDTGGNHGRTIIFESFTGRVFVKTLDKFSLKGVSN